MTVVVSASTLRARNLLRRGDFSRVTNVVYPSVGIFLNYSLENHIGSDCQFVVDLAV